VGGGCVRIQAEGGSIGFEFARKMREKVRGEYRVCSLMKQKKGGGNYAVLYFAGKRKLLYLYYFMMCTWEKKVKSPVTYYWSRSRRS
jgi:hypothetical protein